MKKSVVLGLSFLALLATAFGWWAVSPEGGALLDTSAPGFPRPADPPESATAAPRPKDALAVETVPFDENAEHDLPEPDPRVFDERLQRGTATVTFALRDARGRPLWREALDVPDVKLWSLHGTFRQRERIRFDRHRLELRTPDGYGLEAGRYELTASVGSYGVTTIRFELGKTEHHAKDLRLPGWYRVIGLRFVSPEGDPIPSLRWRPRFQFRPTTSVKDGVCEPAAVLRAPPDSLLTEEFTEMHGSEEYLGRPRAIRHLTNDGLIHVPVIAGIEGKVRTQAASTLFRTVGPTLTSRFDGAEWEDHRITLRPRNDYARRIQRLPVTNPADPGYRLDSSRPRGLPRSPTGLPDPFDLPRNFKATRLVFQSDAPSLRPTLRLETPADRRIFNVRRGEGGTRFADLHAGMTPLLTVTDDRFYAGRSRELVIPDEPIVTLPLHAEGTPCELSVALTPTLAGYARCVTFGLRGESMARAFVSGKTLRLAPAERRERIASYRSTISPVLREALTGETTLVVGLGIAHPVGEADGFGQEQGRDALRYGAAGSLNHSASRGLAIRLTSRERRELGDGRLRLALASRTPVGDAARSGGAARSWLAFRCVDERGRPVPWVEGSVVEAAGHALAMRVRAASRAQGTARPSSAALAAARRPDDELGSSFDALEEFDEGFASPFDEFGTTHRPVLQEPDDEIPVTIPDPLPPDLVATFGEDGARRLLIHNAWYDTRRGVVSSRGGYVVRSLRLVPGRRYALYLWSRSRDDLVPDRRVVFDADAGVTDLGVVSVPGY